jgi:TM2 domain-containing membrane protein YozV
MNQCSYHPRNAALVQCCQCGKFLCPSCDHRVKGFPYCQDCIVTGIELLRRQANTPFAPVVKRQSSPFIATLLSFVCPGLGAVYNGQTSKAIVHFAIFVSLFQMAILSGGTALFVLGFMAMALYAAVDAWRTAQLIRTGISPDAAEDLIVKRLYGNPVMWGVTLAILGLFFFLHTMLGIRLPMRQLMPIILIGLGFYLIWNYLRKKKEKQNNPGEYNIYSPSFIANSGYTGTNFSGQQTSNRDSVKNTIPFNRS